MKKLIFILIFLLLLLFLGNQAQKFSRPNWPNLLNTRPELKNEKQAILTEESAIISSIDKSLPSVVTIGISKMTQTNSFFDIDPLDPFGPFRQQPGKSQKIEQNIGSGFIISSNGLIVTNKHVVSDTEATYRVLTNDNKTYEVKKISRDPLNDLAILKIDTQNLKAITLGDSSTLKLGQMVIAIGTPLGEFQNTVTSGIISGLKRGITAGSPFEGYVERLDNVIQTDAAINPGNSGGPLINLQGDAIGVNTAVSGQGQNLGFAIPIEVVKNLIKNFNQAGGRIERPFLGIRYQMITRQNAILNEVPEGAYILEVVENSPAQKAGLQKDDIITEFDGQKIKGDDDKNLQNLILKKKIGDRINVKIWRDGKTQDKTVILTVFE
ncbi:hypothetical protein A3C23_00630 [Candidatus Roizmanbacteria bacterium RIFCSPHIGHO2_02_FULL_37_13b]|uniref:PDZ domain-containing protein n=1 Tax=Candidatus Roizmanbacteria bacterium RIFCSPLOWO2_02_FULL_36_11 TaxID=1802071 RepID=A0A1F7JD18_9BACT|nr:MAG: hypothetical protein A3C23_00630 [Candidatus Roizmanbacteria bacterium RIFCSPHIGHO2_02_FULL_37_13b]OGK53503.1 MAG: hypothetical protein A3H78_04740 [Candidatus Roizmanbacteria bacterium RIFCSPLOWO2_02_FULL_36_11]